MPVFNRSELKEKEDRGVTIYDKNCLQCGIKFYTTVALCIRCSDACKQMACEVRKRKLLSKDGTVQEKKATCSKADFEETIKIIRGYFDMWKEQDTEFSRDSLIDYMNGQIKYLEGENLTNAQNIELDQLILKIQTYEE